MTENKRFERIYADVDVFCRDHNAKGVSQLIEREDYDKIVDLLNKQHEQIELLKKNFRVLDEINCELVDENEQLKQRNDRQAKQLDRLYSLIEEKEWTALSDIIDDFKRCEEQLQKEWRTYDDFK